MHQSSSPSAIRPAPGRPAPSARAYLLTIFGELVRSDEAVWTAALLRVMRGLGIEDRAARQAISRGAAAGWIEAERVGRARRWRLAERGQRIVDDGNRRREAFLSERGPWDGRWLTLHVSVPHERRAVRRHLYGGLRWMGLGNPAPGVWMTPHTAEEDRVGELLQELELARFAVSTVGPVGNAGLSEDEIVRNAWDLADLSARYRDILAHYGELDPRPGEETLLDHIALLGAMRDVMRSDPKLPGELLPDWAGRDGADFFRRRLGDWTVPAHRSWNEIVAEGPKDVRT